MITENSKIKKYYLAFLILVFPSFMVAQEFVHSTGHRLLWKNPDSTIYNVVYFSSDSSLVEEMDNSVILYNGQPSTVFNLIHLYEVEPLYWNKKYYLRVVEYFSSDFTQKLYYHEKFKDRLFSCSDYNALRFSCCHFNRTYT